MQAIAFLIRSFSKLPSQIKAINPSLIEYQSAINKFTSEKRILSLSEIKGVKSSISQLIQQNQKHITPALTWASYLINSGSILSNFEDQVLKSISLLDKNDLISLARCYSRAKSGSSELFNALLESILSHLPSLDANDINLLVFALYKSNKLDRQILPSLAEQSLKTLNLTQKSWIPNIIQTFSLVGYPEFVKQTEKIILESLSKFTILDKIHILKVFSDCNVQGKEVRDEIKNSLESLDNENFSLLCSYCATNADIRKDFGRILKEQIFKRDANGFSTKAMLLVMNTMHELGSGVQVCEYFAQAILDKSSNFTPYQYPLILYIYGINKQGSNTFWEAFIKRLTVDHSKLLFHHRVWSVYGLFKSSKLSNSILNLLISSSIHTSTNPKDFEKLIEVSAGMENFNILNMLKPVFKSNYQHLKPNKALICIDYYIQNKQSDAELLEILKKLKNRI